MTGEADGVRRLLMAVVLQAAEDVEHLRRNGLVVTEAGVIGEWPKRRNKAGTGDSTGGGYKMNARDALELCAWLAGGHARRWLDLAGVNVGAGVDVEACLMTSGLEGSWERWMK